MIIWLASYPKSGNTWVRSFLSYYLNGNNEEFSFNILNNIKKFPDISILKELKINYEDTSELIKNWITIQDFINLNNKVNLLKTHNALCTVNGHSFTNSSNTKGVIYLVRDPRDVLVSFSNHFNLNLNESLKIMKSDEFWETEKNHNNFKSSLFGSWKSNYNSWTENKSLKKLIIKYEDLEKNPFKYFSKIINFLKDIANIKYNDDLIKLSISKTSFKNLSQLEKKRGFSESTNGYFFRKGYSNQWNELDKNLIQDINTSFEKEMKELNYLN